MPKSTTVKQYLDSLPPDRRAALQAIRKVILANKDPHIEEGIQYGMLGYFVPHSHYPDGYHCDPKQPVPFASLASQKNHMGLYLFCVYTSEADQKWFREAWVKGGRKLDMGKSCVRFKKLEDVPLDVVGKTFKRLTAKKFIAQYEAAFKAGPAKRAKAKSTKKPGTKKPASKKPASKKAASKTAATRKKKTAKKVAKKKTAAKKR